MNIQSIGVIGAGTMGNGIAHVFAQYRFKVTLVDVSTEQLTKAVTAISKNLDRQILKNQLTEEIKAATLANIITDSSLSSLKECDLIIEAATENPTIKTDIFKKIDSCAKPGCILATNTSSISITQLASATSRPEQVIGMHFMNPVPLMKLVEVINGKTTSKSVTDTIVDLTKKLEKVPAVVNDFPGFIANRILMPMINEAIYSLHEGVAEKEAIDTIMKLGMAHPMGPIQLADFIGLDVCLSIMNVLYEGFRTPKYLPCPLLVQMVKEGKLGVKAGEGFYQYENGKIKP